MTTTPPPEPPAPKKRGRPRGKPLDKEHRDARAALILAAKLANKRTSEICEEFNLSRATVYRELSAARKAGLLTQARDWLTLNLTPLALAAIEEALLMGDIPTKVDTAFRVLEGLGITGKHAILHVQEGGAEQSFESFRMEVTRKVIAPAAHREQTTAPETPASQCPGVVDGELCPVPEHPPRPECTDCQSPPCGPHCGDLPCSAHEGSEG